jgi:hypothetical protein
MNEVTDPSPTGIENSNELRQDSQWGGFDYILQRLVRTQSYSTSTVSYTAIPLSVDVVRAPSFEPETLPARLATAMKIVKKSFIGAKG